MSNEWLSSGIMLRFAMTNFSIKEYDEVFKAVKLYFLVNAPAKIIRDNKEMGFKLVDEQKVISYYNKYNAYIDKGKKDNPNGIPANNLIYDYITVAKSDKVEVNIAFSYTNIFITVASNSKSDKLYNMQTYLENEFVYYFREHMLNSIRKQANRLDIDMDTFGKMMTTFKAYSIPVEEYELGLKPAITNSFNTRNKTDIIRLLAMRKYTTKLFATTGQNIILLD